MLPDRETRWAMSFIVWIGVAFLVVVALFVGVRYVALPFLFNLERSATQHSNPYIQSKVSQLVDLKAQYERLETDAAKFKDDPTVVQAIRGQQKAVLQQMREAYALVPDDAKEAVPASIKSFLASTSG